MDLPKTIIVNLDGLRESLLAVSSLKWESLLYSFYDVLSASNDQLPIDDHLHSLKEELMKLSNPQVFLESHEAQHILSSMVNNHCCECGKPICTAVNDNGTGCTRTDNHSGKHKNGFSPVVEWEYETLFRVMIDQSGVSDLELRRTFGISQPTANRWRRGLSVPYLTMRTKVADWLKGKIDGNATPR